jgi:hypothetical protein
VARLRVAWSYPCPTVEPRLNIFDFAVKLNSHFVSFESDCAVDESKGQRNANSTQTYNSRLE